MPPVRCSGKTPAATSGRSQPAGSRTDISSGKSAVFSPRFSPFAAMPPATIVQPHKGDRSPRTTVPAPAPRTAIPPTKRFRPSCLSKNADERINHRQDFSSPFWHLSFHMFYTTIFFVVFLTETNNEKTRHRVSRLAVVCLFPASPSWRRPGRQWRHAQSGRPRPGSRRRTPLKPELVPDPPVPP